MLEIQLRQSQKMEALGTLAGGIAHDFNNILGTIQGFAQILAADLAQGTPQHGFAQRVLAACDRGKDVVEQILAFARSGVHDRLVIDLARTVRECEALLAQALPKSTQLEFVFANEPLHARAHPGQISQLILNLGRNASDSLNGNPGLVKVELYRPSREEITARKEFRPQPNNLMIGTVDVSQTYACIAVSDNGSGIAPEILKRIFDPFFTTKGRQRGTGLGLAVAHGVIEAHGGACCVETTPAQGTRFSFYLPTTSEAPQFSGLPVTGTKALRGHERVLIVDDEQDIADMLAIGLDRLGYEVAAVIDPLEALSAFEEDPDAWDAVIADQLMPQMRGVEFLRKLKTARPNIKTVLCTGFSEGAEGELVASGAIDLFVKKPTDAQGIASSLRILFDKSERRAAADAPVS
jgi:nitrogen-specific signal transduction histidine kinase/CheY-like chemotaxis protein